MEPTEDYTWNVVLAMCSITNKSKLTDYLTWLELKVQEIDGKEKKSQ